MPAAPPAPELVPEAAEPHPPSLPALPLGTALASTSEPEPSDALPTSAAGSGSQLGSTRFRNPADANH
eukprot:4442698-Alexandrium_andersonii.AAC.1